MKKNRFVLIITLIHFATWNYGQPLINPNRATFGETIRLNQLGYLPGHTKKALVVNSSAKEFHIIDTAGNTIFRGNLVSKGNWEASGENISIADFSLCHNPGKYYISIDDTVISCPFWIDNEIYSDVFKSSIRAFYLHRLSTPLEIRFAGEFSRPAAHPDTLCYFHPSSGRTSGFKSCPGGWYDAGDYNKYIVNGGFTVSTMLTLYEYYPGLVPDNYLNIPESGNGISDLLDEVKFELDWAETMQDEDGGVFFKLTSKTFCGFIKPDEDTSMRFIVGKSTSSSLNFAAMFAQAGRIWKNLDPGLSDHYLDISKKAWDWAVEHPDVVFRNPPDIFTGAYSHSDFKKDFYWAAAELYVSTGEIHYLDYLKSNAVQIRFEPSENWRTFLDFLGSYALLLPSSQLEEKDKNLLKKSLLDEADRQLALMEERPARMPLDTFVWGSNSDVIDIAIIFTQAYQLSHDNKYLDAAIECTDYIFGRNGIGISFVTGFGCNPVMNPHHRLAASDNVEGPIPGWVSGGPNAHLNDKKSTRNTWGVEYSSTLPAKAFMDVTGSFASNEIAINWNASLVYITGFLNTLRPGMK